MLDQNKIGNLEHALKRIFALPINRTTFRQVQNVLLGITDGNRDDATQLLDFLYTGDAKKNFASGTELEVLKKIPEKFAVPLQVARDVFERGEYLGLLSSDMITQQNRILFSNSIRRVDGEEVHFITDVDSTLQIVHHFLSRLEEIKNISGANVGQLKKELGNIHDKLGEWLGA